MAAKNNTTTLNMGGTIGTRNLSDFTAKQISSSISRTNYRSQVVSDERLQKFRDAVYKLVSNWTREDKLMIISEYGDTSALGKNPSRASDELINKVITESLIIHLDPNDLQQLYNDVMMSTNSLKKDIRKIRAKQRTNRKRFNISNFNSAFENVKDAKNARQFRRKQKAFDRGFRVPRYIRRLYKGLRKELMDVLTTCFNVVELTGIAYEMNIEITDGMKPKDLKNEIINKVCLYVDLITGKAGKHIPLSGAFMKPEPFENILKYTSYAYVTGNPSIDPSEWVALKDKARRAKIAIKERAKQTKKKALAISKSVQAVAGTSRRRTERALARKINKKDEGILKDASYEKLVELAGKYNIDATKYKDLGKLKARIYMHIAAENKRIGKLEKKAGISREQIQKQRQKVDPVTGKPLFDSKGKPILEAAVDENGNPIYDSKSRVIEKNKFFVSGKRRRALHDLMAVHANYSVSDILGNTSEELKPDVIDADPNEMISKIVLSQNSILEKINLHFPELITKTTEGNTTLTNILGKITPSEKFDDVINKIGECSKILELIKSKLDVLPSMSDASVKTLEHVAEIRAKLEGANFEVRLQELTDLATNRNTILDTINSKILDDGSIKEIYNTLIKMLDILESNKGISDILTRIDDNIVKLSADIIEAKDTLVSISESIDRHMNVMSDHYIKVTGILESMDDKLSNLSTINTSVSDIRDLVEKISNKSSGGNGGNGGGGTPPKIPTFDSKCIINKLSEIASLITDGNRTFADYYANTTIHDRLEGILSKATNFDSIFTKYYGNSDIIDTLKSTQSTLTNSLISEKFVPLIKNFENVKDLAGAETAVAVYVVNPWDTGNKVEGREEYTEGIGANTDSVRRYQEKNNLTPTSGNNSIVLTRRVDEIRKDMIDRGYNPTSHILQDPKDPNANAPKTVPSVGNQYKLTTADLNWATANGLKFATGGMGEIPVNNNDQYTFDVGDSVDGKENVERVTITNKGFKVEPLVASPSNNYSPFALNQHVKKYDAYATGGVGKVTDKVTRSTVSGKSFLERFLDDMDSPAKKNQEKLNKEIQFINTKNTTVASVATMGLNPENYNIVGARNEKQLDKAIARALKDYKVKQKQEPDMPAEREPSLISDEARRAGITLLDKKPAIPVYVVNDALSSSADSLKSVLNDGLGSVVSAISSNFSTLFSGLAGPWTVTAPYGVGAMYNPVLMGTGIAAKVQDTILDAVEMGADEVGQMFTASTGGKITKMNTGGSVSTITKGPSEAGVKRTGRAVPRFASGGTSVITGDAAGTNIFANGAKPELVQSSPNGDLSITPLNKDEGSQQRHKIDRMTSSERKSALATAISSHVVKYNYKLSNEASEVSNAGEAIKVFNVKPGITDVIDIGGEQTTLAHMIANIYAQLAVIAGNTEASNGLLGAIASKPAANVSVGGGGGGDANPFAGGFPSSLDGILGGE